MKFLNLGSINKNLTLLVMLAVLPALAILLYTGIEQRRHSIKNAKHDLMILTHGMAEVQQNITKSTKQILSTLSLLPAIQDLDIKASSEIFRAVLEQNPTYQNITLTDSNGDVLASGIPFGGKNLRDRKHVREALDKKDFAVGEYIVTRVGKKAPALAFAYPVLDKKGSPIAVLTTALSLDRFSRFYNASHLPEKSFVAVTDHQGIRLFFYPQNRKTNPVGKPIQAKSWGIASKAQEPGMFIGEGSDGVRRIFAFEKVRYTPEASPYIYVWAGVPEDYILKPANAALIRNLLLMFLVTVISLLISWAIGKNTLISPIKNLVTMAQKFAEGNLEARDEQVNKSDEFWTLTKAFHDMAENLLVGQKALKENEARFRLLMDSLDSLIYVADMSTYEVLFINEYGRKIFGDITGKICWQSVQDGQSGPCSFCTNKYLLDGKGKPGETYTWEFQNPVTRQWFYTHDRAITWVDGRIVRLQVATDISERKRTENRLSEETERLAVTLKSIGDGVITTDTHGNIVLMNKIAEELTGWSQEEALMKPSTEVFHIINEKTRERCDNPVKKVLSSGSIIGLASHTVLIAKDTTEKNIADSGAPIRDKESRIIGVVLVFRDVTQSKKMEEELLKVKKLESVAVLAGGIAHDFNNILTAMLGNIDLALLDTNLGIETKKLLVEAHKASIRAKDLTQQLLTFSKGGEPIKEASAIPEVIEDSAEFILHGSNVVCQYTISENLWLVDIDKGQMSQVIQNLILNAKHAMPEGGIIHITCENVDSLIDESAFLSHQEKHIKITITDSGIGIPANALDKIFDPYFSTKQEGSGLGLAISHSIITKHNGHLSVESTPGVGTTFAIDLPVSADSKEKEQRVESVEETKGTAKIMVMDDEELVREVAQSMLSVMGHDVVLAEDGTEAVKLYKEHSNTGNPIDIVIMDLTIPGGMGGKDAINEILAFDPDAKAIVSSGYSNDQIMANSQDYGFYAAIVKPYQLKELTKVINRVMA